MRTSLTVPQLAGKIWPPGRLGREGRRSVSAAAAAAAAVFSSTLEHYLLFSSLPHFHFHFLPLAALLNNMNDDTRMTVPRLRWIAVVVMVLLLVHYTVQ